MLYINYSPGDHVRCAVLSHHYDLLGKPLKFFLINSTNNL